MNIKHTSKKTRRILIDNQPKNLFAEDKYAHLYEERALLLATDNDIVILRKLLPDEYLRFVMVNSKFQVVFLRSFDNMQDLVDTILDKYNICLIREAIKIDLSLFDNIIQAYIPDERIDLLATEFGIPVCGQNFYMCNHKKSDTQRICMDLRLNVIPSLLINELADFDKKEVFDFINAQNNIVIKPNIGVGGQSINFYSTEKTPNSLSKPVIIQKFLDAQFEGSIQFIKFPEGWRIFFCETLQNNNKFFGFKYPFPTINYTDLQKSAYKFLDYFATKYGDDLPSFGIDFIINNEEIFFHDINPRSTGVTYIFSLLLRLYGENALNDYEIIYLQRECDHKYSYSELKNKLDKCGLIHISQNTTDGYALLYPSLLEARLINILLVSSIGKVREYYRMISPVIGQPYIKN